MDRFTPSRPGAGSTVPTDKAVVTPLVETVLGWDLSTPTGVPDLDACRDLLALFNAYVPVIASDLLRLCGELPQNSRDRLCAEATLGEAERRLRAQPVGPTPKEVAERVKNFARLVRALHGSGSQVSKAIAHGLPRPAGQPDEPAQDRP